MTSNEKRQKILVAKNIIETIMGDTDEDLWAMKFLEDADVALIDWLEEIDV